MAESAALAPARHSVPQPSQQDLVVDAAKVGQLVVANDPFDSHHAGSPELGHLLVGEVATLGGHTLSQVSECHTFS
jgi:hypothetical protein